ncbi:MAG: RNA pseudouridine synthase [Endomicrobiaceae bacterium]|jgi:23S rRNA pseudouridine955/2504/2580 synthase/23S rRNA pseudouridine1911/1915/1917 synthase|nr:RNA pseudouridine synthase [Endomicrobiaceae bacterium]MDD3729743.1 RNA pseudouridine synthase [Endomicrobiaceae bacterium]MDD4165662.1 RNA pseudouridine synthase [Endomicrobiaceae bacterium]
MKNDDMKVIFENNDVLILDKPSGVMVLPGAGEDSKEKISLLGELKNGVNKKIIPITSLDSDATGIVLFAKNKNAYDFIAKQIKDNKTEKTFLIIVNGAMQNEEGRIEKRVISDGERTIINDKGIISSVNYKVIEKFRDFALIEVKPSTSIRNQIRALFWSEGNPLAVDKIYASSEPVLLSSLKRRYKGKDGEKPLLKRLPLHFAKIRLMLPGSSEASVFQSPLPKDMEITLKQLRKYNRIF